MLSKYLAATKQVILPNTRKAQVQRVVSQPSNSLRVSPPVKGAPLPPRPKVVTAASIAQPVGQVPVVPAGEKKPFFIGEVKNNKHISLPGILIYVKDGRGTPVRLLKTNPHGIFATYNPLVPGEYSFEMKDPKNIYFFDTMKIAIGEHNQGNIEIVSKEML